MQHRQPVAGSVANRLLVLRGRLLNYPDGFVRASATWPHPRTWRLPVGPPAVDRVRAPGLSIRGRLPIPRCDTPYSSLRVQAPAVVSSLSDTPFLHARPRCLLASRLWRALVVVRLCNWDDIQSYNYDLLLSVAIYENLLSLGTSRMRVTASVSEPWARFCAGIFTRRPR
jgi:hypothetical protein